jgi:hypothetical protein
MNDTEGKVGEIKDSLEDQRTSLVSALALLASLAPSRNNAQSSAVSPAEAPADGTCHQGTDRSALGEAAPPAGQEECGADIWMNARVSIKGMDGVQHVLVMDKAANKDMINGSKGAQILMRYCSSTPPLLFGRGGVAASPIARVRRSELHHTRSLCLLVFILHVAINRRSRFFLDPYH